MLIITGLGRCGTSCLANYCCLLGHDTGGGWQDGINAGRELPAAIAINNEIMAGYQSGLLNYARLDRQIRAIDRAVIKDPRFTWDCPYILKAWAGCRDDLKFLVCHRDFDRLVRSKAATHSSSLQQEGECRKTFFAFVERLLRLNLPFRTLKFPDFLGRFDEVYDALAHFGALALDRGRAEEAWRGWADPGKVHF